MWRAEVGDFFKILNTNIILRSLMKDIFELKTKSGSASDLIEKRIQASLLFVTLKKLNRLEKLR